MVKFMNWAQGILTLQPSAADYVADVHPSSRRIFSWA